MVVLFNPVASSALIKGVEYSTTEIAKMFDRMATSWMLMRRGIFASEEINDAANDK